jgi:hypothetical protein
LPWSEKALRRIPQSELLYPAQLVEKVFDRQTAQGANPGPSTFSASQLLCQKTLFFVKRFAPFSRYQSGHRHARFSGKASAILGLQSDGSPDGLHSGRLPHRTLNEAIARRSAPGTNRAIFFKVLHSAF